MQSVSSRIWTRVAVSISHDGNHYTMGTSSFMLHKAFTSWALYHGILVRDQLLMSFEINLHNVLHILGLAPNLHFVLIDIPRQDLAIKQLEFLIGGRYVVILITINLTNT